MRKGKSIYRASIRGLILLVSFALLYPTSALLQDEKGVEEMIKKLKDENPLVRWHPVEQLGRAKDARAVEPLIEALRDRDEGVRREAIKSLGKIGSARAVDPLGRMLKDSDEFVRLNALWALENIGGNEATTLIITALKNDNSLVRMNAAASLGRRGSSQAIGPLEEVARTDAQSYVRFAAQQALVQIRGETAVVKPTERAKTKPPATVTTSPTMISELEQVAQRIKGEYGLVLNYKKYDIMDLLDIEARMEMRHPRDTIESVLGSLLTPEDTERNRHLFEKKE